MSDGRGSINDGKVHVRAGTITGRLCLAHRDLVSEAERAEASGVPERIKGARKWRKSAGHVRKALEALGLVPDEMLVDQ